MTQLVLLQPTVEAYARLSKQYTDMTFVQGTTVSRLRAVELNTKAVDYANQALELDPQNADGHVARCVSRGRLALVSDNRTKVRVGTARHFSSAS